MAAERLLMAWTKVQQTCVQQTCVQQTCVQQTCVQQTCVQQTCVQQGCVQQTCVQQTCVQQGCVQQTCVQQGCVQQTCVQQTCVQQGCVQQTCVQQGWGGDLEIATQLRERAPPSRAGSPVAGGRSRNRSRISLEPTSFASGREAGALDRRRTRISKSAPPARPFGSRNQSATPTLASDFEIAAISAERQSLGATVTLGATDARTSGGIAAGDRGDDGNSGRCSQQGQDHARRPSSDAGLR